VCGSKLVNAVDPTVLDGAGDTYHMIGLVWRMGNSSPVLTSEDVDFGFPQRLARYRCLYVPQYP